MKVLVGTPTPGSVTTQYFLSMLDTVHQVTLHKQELLRQLLAANPQLSDKNPNDVAAINQTMARYSYDLNIYTLQGESLIQRGRNHIAQVALSEGYDKLLFIDSDAGWTWPQMKKILDNPAPLISGLCPLKTYPISLNFLPYAEDEKFFHQGIRSLEGTKSMVEAKGSPIVKVPFVGTAFMCISRQVLMRLAETCAHYVYPNPYTGQPQSHWDFFNVSSVNDTFLSEDWGFCHRAREAGFDVLIDTDVIITHTGNHTYRV